MDRAAWESLFIGVVMMLLILIPVTQEALRSPERKTCEDVLGGAWYVDHMDGKAFRVCRNRDGDLMPPKELGP